LAQADRVGPKVGGHLALVLHSSDEPGELSQWHCTATTTPPQTLSFTITITVAIRAVPSILFVFYSVRIVGRIVYSYSAE